MSSCTALCTYPDTFGRDGRLYQDRFSVTVRIGGKGPPFAFANTTSRWIVQLKAVWSRLYCLLPLRQEGISPTALKPYLKSILIGKDYIRGKS